MCFFFFFSSRRRHTRCSRDWSSDVCSSDLVRIQVVGTPDDCIQQVAELHRLTGTDHLVTEFGYGAMPHEQAELNMRLFADRVVPVLQRDTAFAGASSQAGDRPAGTAVPGGIFAPA